LYLILLGLPGAGKGTQAERISRDTSMAHITSGGLFRENIGSGTHLGRRAQSYVEKGLLVPNDVTVGMILERIGQPDAASGFILDGFPRNVEQARALDEALAGRGKAIDKAVYMKVSEAELVRRLAGRWNCSQCAAVYHEQNNPPRQSGVCDNCGGELSQREDDRPEVVRTRLEVNAKEMDPLLDYYRQAGKLTEIDGEREPERVREDLLAALGKRQGVS
jgi:adenylate kinase